MSDPSLVVRSSTDTAERALQTVQQQWNVAAADWNPEKLTAVYTDDALFYGGYPELFAGRERIREYFESYVGVLRSTHLNLIDQHILKLGPDTFLAQGLAHFHFVLDSGKKTETKMRTTLVLVKRDGNWKLTQHHFSTMPSKPPIDE